MADPTETLSPGDGPGPVEVFRFGPFLTDLPTCEPVTFNWTWFGNRETFALSVLPTIAPHTDLPGPDARKRADPLPIAVNLITTDEQCVWPTVDIPQGWYELRAVDTDNLWSATSAPFMVVNGTDTSCLYPASSSSSSPSPTPTPTSTSSTGSVSSSSTSSAAALPVAAASTSARTGAIAGGVVGGVVILAAAIAGYVYFGLCRRTPTRSRRRAMEGPEAGQLGKWGGLSSRDSGMDAPMSGPNRPALAMALPSKKRGKTDSTSGMLSPLSSTAHGHPAAARCVSDEDVSTLAEEEKGVPYSKGQEYIETVPPLAYNRRRSSASTSGGGLSPIASIPEPPPSAGSMGRSRARSSSQSHRAMAFAKLDGNDSAPASPRTRSPTVPRRSIDGPSPMAMPASPPYDAPMNRSSSGGGPGPRRAARKPVPQLDASELSTPPTPVTNAGASVSRGQSLSSTVTAASSTPVPASSAHPMYRHESHSSANVRTLAPGRQHSREDLEAAGMELPNLNHKSSFGDRPVHYLIPDMPPPPPRN